ncbi:MAG: hypothetical protein ACPGSD_12155 [Flavobacteriales bacterium]
MCSYISYNCLVNVYGVSTNTINKGVSVNRKRKSNLWMHKRDSSDNRRVLIDIDSIPTATRKKYNIPTSKELQEELSAKQEERIKIEQDQRKSRYLKAFESALNSDYTVFISEYSKHTDTDKRRDLAKLHALYTAILKIVGTKRIAKGVLQEVFDVYGTLEFTGKLKEKASFCRKVKKAQKDIKSAVEHGCTGNTYRRKIGEFHHALILMYAMQPNIYSGRVICDMVNLEAEKHNQCTVAYSTIRDYLRKKEIKNQIEQYRYGGKSFRNNVLPFLPRTPEEFAGDLWAMDGTPVQFFAFDPESKKRVRLNLYAIIDAFSGQIVGYDVSISEDRFNVLNALKMAFSVKGHLPTEILHDNFSANKTSEVKKIKGDLESLGVLFRASKPDNPKDKTHIERYFGTFQSTIQKLYDDYLGEGIRSKRKNGRPDESYPKKARKIKEPTIEEMKYRIAKMIGQYNNLSIGDKASPSKRYEVSPKPNVRELSTSQIPFLFWYKTSVTVRNSMVSFIVKGQRHYFEIKNHNHKLELNGSKIDVFYDEKDLSSVQIFYKDTDRVICECRKIDSPKASQIGRDSKADLSILKHDAKNKSFNKHIHDKTHDEIARGLKSVGLTEFTPTDPLSTDKYNVNNRETKLYEEWFLNENQIDSSKMDVYQSQTPRKTFYADKQIDLSKYERVVTKTGKLKPLKKEDPKDNLPNDKR